MLIKPVGGASSFLGLSDTFASYTNKAKRKLRINSAETAIEAIPDIFGDSAAAKEFDAACAITTTTLSATLDAGSMTMSVADASSFATGQGVAIPGAGVAGAELVTTITGVGANTISFSDATSTTVASGTTIYHDDTAALNAALASGLHIYLEGKCHTTGTIVMNTSYQLLFNIGIIVGYGWKSAWIYPRSLTADAIDMTGAPASAAVAGLNIYHDTAATAGHDIILGYPAGSYNQTSNVYKIKSWKPYIGVKIRNGYTHVIDDYSCSFPQMYGLYMSGLGTSGGNKFHNISIGNSGGLTTAKAIYVDASDHNEWLFIGTGGDGFAVNIHLDAQLDNIGPQIFTQVSNDDVRNIGVKLSQGGSYKLVAPQFNGLFNNLLRGSGGSKGVEVGANVEGTTINGGVAQGTLGVGIEDGGKNTSISTYNCRPSGGGTTNTYDAYVLKSTSVGCTLDGSHGNNSRYGLTIESGARYPTITGNNFNNNGTGASNIAADVLTTAKISNNQGITDSPDSGGGDIDGGAFTDTYINTADIDGGGFV